MNKFEAYCFQDSGMDSYKPPRTFESESNYSDKPPRGTFPRNGVRNGLNPDDSPTYTPDLRARRGHADPNENDKLLGLTTPV